jgi:hypothetical protein
MVAAERRVWRLPAPRSPPCVFHLPNQACRDSFAGACGGVLVFGDQSIAHLKGDPKVRQHPQFCSAFALISRRILQYLFP